MHSPINNVTCLLSVFCAQVNSRFGQVSNVTGDVQGLISVHPDLPGFGEFRRSNLKLTYNWRGRVWSGELHECKDMWIRAVESILMATPEESPTSPTSIQMNSLFTINIIISQQRQPQCKKYRRYYLHFTDH